MKITWNVYNPIQFDVVGAGYDQGKFGLASFANPPNPIQFDVSGQGFDQGQFGSSTSGDPSVSAPQVYKTLTGLVVGVTYDVSAWVYVPASNGVQIMMGITGQVTSANTSGTGSFQEVTFSFTATSTTHEIFISPVSIPADGSLTYVDEVQFFYAGEEITDTVLSRNDLQMSMGRDLDRSVGKMQAGSMSLTLDNQDRRYTPNNPTSPLYGYLGPGKPFLFYAEYGGKRFNLFQGFVDDYTIDPTPMNKSVGVSVLDLLGQMSQITLSTKLRKGKRTGELINYVLDEIGWDPEKRDIDQGASVVRYWWVEGGDALQAIIDIVNSEGLPAITYVDEQGNFVFRDRHHRLIDSRSTAIQASIYGDGNEPGMSADNFSYDIGWKDLINSFDLTISERAPSSTLVNVYQSTDTFTVAAGQTYLIKVSGSDPFFGAVAPQLTTDYTLVSGDATVTLSRTSGAATNIQIYSLGGATITGMNLRAYSVPVAQTIKVTGQDDASIQTYGVKSYTDSMPWASANDAYDIMWIYLGHRSDRLPVITYELNNDNNTRMTTLLGTRLSDRVHLVEPETYTNGDYFVEQIQHTISEAGLYHKASFGCEKVRTQPTSVFTFDDATRGFDAGYFGYSGIDTSSTMFILDQSNLDQGLLAF